MVLKSSELSPRTHEIIVELMHEVGLIYESLLHYSKLTGVHSNRSIVTSFRPVYLREYLI